MRLCTRWSGFMASKTRFRSRWFGESFIFALIVCFFSGLLFAAGAERVKFIAGPAIPRFSVKKHQRSAGQGIPRKYRYRHNFASAGQSEYDACDGVAGRFDKDNFHPRTDRFHDGIYLRRDLPGV